MGNLNSEKLKIFTQSYINFMEVCMDLITLLQICKNTNDTQRNLFTKEHNIDIQKHELLTLASLIKSMLTNSDTSKQELSFYTEHFWLGFKIPQIGEEFDLLRFGDNYHINIELKSDNLEEKMKKQLIRKKHYLNFLELNTYHYIYSSESSCLYKLNEQNALIETTFIELLGLLKEQLVNDKSKNEIEKLFNVSNYLISPFNSTERFLDSSYFLTNHQQLIKNEIFKNINNSNLFFMIEGSAGTGKTLLVYDFVKNCKENKMKVLVIHCGQLNAGHIKLRNNYGWEICPIKLALEYLSNELDVIVVDESQRLDKQKFDYIIKFCEEQQIPCVFSLDKRQCLHISEINREMRTCIANITDRKNQHKLKEKIRSNKELALFIKLFNKIPINSDYKLENENYNIKIKYFDTKEEADKFVEFQKKLNWKYLTYSNSLYNNEYLDKLVSHGEDTPHKVIGQEFDKVVVMMDDNFTYKLNEEKQQLELLGRMDNYYHTTKMLFQNMTRARRQLSIVIINNPDLLLNLTKILINF